MVERLREGRQEKQQDPESGSGRGRPQEMRETRSRRYDDDKMCGQQDSYQRLLMIARPFHQTLQSLAI